MTEITLDENEDANENGASAPTNAVFTLTSKGTGDPFLVLAHDKCYLTYTTGKKHVVIWKCDDFRDFAQERSVHIIWKPPPGQPHSSCLWAPELHEIDGRWYIYVVAADEALQARSRRIHVLRGPLTSEEPTPEPNAPLDENGCAPGWTFLGRIEGMPDARAIDATVFTLQGQLYMAYSGRAWADEEEGKFGNQSIFLMRMRDAATASSLPVMIAHPTRRWEFTNGIGCNEGPQWLEAPEGSDSEWKGLVFSAASAATPQYKMGTLEYVDGDPLSPTSWRKGDRPLLRTTKGRAPFGPGHGNFVTIGKDVLACFHATDNATDGLKNRRARLAWVGWNELGKPSMGEWIGELTSELSVFEKGRTTAEPPMGKRGFKALFQTEKSNGCN